MLTSDFLTIYSCCLALGYKIKISYYGDNTFVVLYSTNSDSTFTLTFDLGK